MPKTMVKKEFSKQNFRMIHVRLPAILYKKLKIHVVEEDTTIQAYISEIIKKAISKKGRKK